MDIASPMLPAAEEFDSSSCCELDNTALTALIKFQKENNPRLRGKSNRDIAEACGMSENTLCAILKGKNRNPRVGTLVCIIRAIGGGSIDRLVGLAPHRDYAKEEAVFDATLVETLQARLDEKREIIADLKAQLADADKRLVNLRNIIHQEGHDGKMALGQVKEMEQRLADKREQVAEQQKTIAEQKTEIRKLRAMGICLTFALIAVMAFAFYLVWEIANPTLGNFRY